LATLAAKSSSWARVFSILSREPRVPVAGTRKQRNSAGWVPCSGAICAASRSAASSSAAVPQQVSAMIFGAGIG
jgi:hypothetical protein